MILPPESSPYVVSSTFFNFSGFLIVVGNMLKPIFSKTVIYTNVISVHLLSSLVFINCEKTHFKGHLTF